MASQYGEQALEGRIVQIKGGEMVIGNIGQEQGARTGDQFLVYSLGEEVFDPETGTSLGRLEQVKGVFVVRHAQQRMSQLARLDEAPSTQQNPEVLSSVMAHTHGGGPRVARIQVGDNLRSLPRTDFPSAPLGSGVDPSLTDGSS